MYIYIFHARYQAISCGAQREHGIHKTHSGHPCLNKVMTQAETFWMLTCQMFCKCLYHACPQMMQNVSKPMILTVFPRFKPAK